MELKVTFRVLASQPAKSAVLELGVNLASASPIFARVRVFVESYQPRKLYPVREAVLARRVSPEVVVLVAAATEDPPFELYDKVL